MELDPNRFLGWAIIVGGTISIAYAGERRKPEFFHSLGVVFSGLALSLSLSTKPSGQITYVGDGLYVDEKGSYWHE